MEKEYSCSLMSDDVLNVDTTGEGTVTFYISDDGLASTGIILDAKKVKKLVKQLKNFLKEYDSNE